MISAYMHWQLWIAVLIVIIIIIWIIFGHKNRFEIEYISYPSRKVSKHVSPSQRRTTQVCYNKKIVSPDNLHNSIENERSVSLELRDSEQLTTPSEYSISSEYSQNPDTKNIPQIPPHPGKGSRIGEYLSCYILEFLLGNKLERNVRPKFLRNPETRRMLD